MTHRSIVEAIRSRAEEEPDRSAFVFLSPDGTAQTVPIGQLHADAVQNAQRLSSLGIRAGDLVILVFDHSYELVAALFGAIYAGAVPSIFPYFTPGVGMEVYRQRVERLAIAAGARAILTSASFEPHLKVLLAPTGCQVLNLQATEPSDAALFVETNGGDQTAYLQWSSGTTGLPKGVVLTHQAILNRMARDIEALRFTRDDVSVGWLPLFHDMGLFTQIFIPVLAGGLSVLMPPAYWVRQPKALLRAIHQYRGTISWMPNFAFNHCVNNIRDEDIVDVDLSSWRFLGNGSELVQLESLQAFAARFAPFGFRAEALSVAWGMAENVLIATLTPPEQNLRSDWVSIRALQEGKEAVAVGPDTVGAKQIVSCGYPLPDVELAIASEEGAMLPERQIGEILLRSSSLFSSYYRQPERTAEAMRDGWFHTGDVGYLAGGQLYMVERKQDLIIVGGRNIRPHDIESLAREMVPEESGRIVAFGVRDEQLGTERPIVVCEMRATWSAEAQHEVARRIRQRVFQELDVALGDVCFVEKGWVVKTTSGKISRRANQQKFEAELQSA